MATYYSILIDGDLKFSNLTEEEYFDKMEDLSIEYYKTGLPDPQNIETKIKEN
jgi:hypothetical protein